MGESLKKCPACGEKLTWQNELWSHGVETRYICPKCDWSGMGPLKPGKPTVDSTGKPLE
jgi:predicted RNA-binding Zn-ribbon protein involved in translation (DUF1610 family)